jgi:hypothetical protein
MPGIDPRHNANRINPGLQPLRYVFRISDRKPDFFRKLFSRAEKANRINVGR